MLSKVGGSRDEDLRGPTVSEHVVAIPAKDTADAVPTTAPTRATPVIVIYGDSLRRSAYLAPPDGTIPVLNGGEVVLLHELVVVLTEDLVRSHLVHAIDYGAWHHRNGASMVRAPGVGVGFAEVAVSVNSVAATTKRAPASTSTMCPYGLEGDAPAHLSEVPIAKGTPPLDVGNVYASVKPTQNAICGQNPAQSPERGSVFDIHTPTLAQKSEHWRV